MSPNRVKKNPLKSPSLFLYSFTGRDREGGEEVLAFSLERIKQHMKQKWGKGMAQRAFVLNSEIKQLNTQQPVGMHAASQNPLPSSNAQRARIARRACSLDNRKYFIAKENVLRPYDMIYRHRICCMAIEYVLWPYGHRSYLMDIEYVERHVL